MFWLTIIAAIILRVYLITRDSIPFAYDMGRDLLWSKDIVFYHTPTLIGPAASIWGVYFAPFWYYFLSIPLLITNGHPLSAVYTTASTIILTGIIAFLFFKKYLGKFLAVILCSLILFNSTLINLSTFAFHANLLPLLTLLSVVFCFLAVVKNPLYLAAAFFATSLMFSADPAPAVVFTFVPIFIFFYFKLYKGWVKNVSLSIACYLLPLAPLILFELRNNFVQTKSLLAYFSGNNPSLSGQLPLLERTVNRLLLYWEFFKQSFAAGSVFLSILFLAIIVVGLYKFWQRSNRIQKTLIIINLIFLILTFLIFTFLVTVEVKGWYIYGITPIISIILALSLYGFREHKLKLLSFLALYLIVNLAPFFKSDRIEKAKNDPAQLKNQLAAVELIYRDSGNQPFSVYTFTPSIYDYNYQYLFWWQSKKKGKTLPADFAYLPNVPAYVRNKSFYQSQTQQQNIAYLIIENAKENEFYTSASWIATFDDYKPVWRKYIGKAIVVEKRQK